MIPFGTILAVLAIAAIATIVVARVEGLGFLLPKSTRGLGTSAQGFCSGRCRHPDGFCPLSGSKEPSAACPLWNYVEADVRTTVYGSPFSLV